MTNKNKEYLFVSILAIVFIWGCNKNAAAIDFKDKYNHDEFIIDYIKEKHPGLIKEAQNAYDDLGTELIETEDN